MRERDNREFKFNRHSILPFNRNFLCGGLLVLIVALELPSCHPNSTSNQANSTESTPTPVTSSHTALPIQK